nr:hypothetical protein [uncultured Rhodopila sp.]
MLKSAATEHPAIEVLQRPHFTPRLLPSCLDDVRRIFAKAELVTIAERMAVCRDPTDDKFLELGRRLKRRALRWLTRQ